ncbi:MAG: hypothetical protein ACPGXL_04775 [Chitinophagales bacterium]
MKILNIRYLACLIYCLIHWHTTIAQPAGLPQNAIAGKCYERCLVPDEYEIIMEQVLIKEASTRIETIPAVYDTVIEEILLKDGFVLFEMIPATYTVTTEEIMIAEPYSVIEYSPIVFETIQELIILAPRTVKLVQKSRLSNCLSVNPEACIVWCLEEEGPILDTIESQIVRIPMLPIEKTIPAQYKTLEITLVKDPAKLIRLEYPPEYRTYEKLVLLEPVKEKVIQVPAEYATVNTKKLLKAAHFGDWIETDCLAQR